MRGVFFGLLLVLAASAWWGIFFWWNYNPLKTYGVSYQKTWGEHASLQHLQFYWDRNGRRVVGPEITDDDLSVTYRFVDHDDVPEIVVRSGDYKSHLVILKLNFTDANKPEFEMLDNQMMGVWYPPPWENYYRTDKPK